MAQNLYRFYLYAVSIALLIFGVVALDRLLSTLLAFTPLRGSYGSVPTQSEVVQSVAFAVVSLVIVAVLGGLHYWLIRRDIRNHPSAGTSAIRSFFLNIPEAISISLAIPFVGFAVIASLAQFSGSNVVGAASFSLPLLALAALLEMERRRTQATSGPALAFQRLHLYGVQLILLVFLSISWFTSIRSIVDSLFFAGRAALEECAGNPGCQVVLPNIPGLALSVIWFVAAWIAYGFMVKNDRTPFLRLILHGASLAYGVGLLLYGLYIGLELLISPFFKIPISFKDVLGWYPAYDFVSPLTLGMLVIAVYHYWMRTAARQELINRAVLLLTECAIIGTLAAASFWWGYGHLLYNAIQFFAPTPTAPDARSWVSAIAFLIAGAGYIAFDLYLLHRYAGDPSLAAAPRRGFVLTLLGSGILAFAIGGAIALYAWATALFGSPIANWQQVAHAGLASFVVGLFLVAIYLWRAFREHLFATQAKPSAPASVPTPASPVPSVQAETIETILDDLLAGKATREEAAAHIRALEHSPSGATGSS